MDKEYEKCSPKFMSSVKEEFIEENTDNKIFVRETIFNQNNIELEDYVGDTKTEPYEISATVDNIKMEVSPPEIYKVKVEDQICALGDIKNEFDNELLFCDQCHEYYKDYCAKCGMLVHILNRNAFSNTDNVATQEIPIDILEIRELTGGFGIFTLKVIPEGVKFGPFGGLNTSAYPCRLKGGRIKLTEDTSKYLNWMQYINPAINIFHLNLIPFRCKDNLYYRSIRKIQAGEELLVYFGEKYEESVNKDTEVDWTPTIEHDTKDVFACTFCCLGFCSMEYLAKHKRICPNKFTGKFTIKELAQCQFCNIYMEEKECIEYHNKYCCNRNVRKHIPLAMANPIEEAKRDEPEQSQMYECQFKIQNLPSAHVKDIHVSVKGRGKRHRDQLKCSMCEYQTKYRFYLDIHFRTKHLKEFNYHCEMCDYKTNYKPHYERHAKAKHLKEFSYKCKLCRFKTNEQYCLEKHIKTKHLEMFTYKCMNCEFQTNYKANFEMHKKTRHLKEFKYKCESCEYQTNSKSNLSIHTEAKHLQEFDCYKCEICKFETKYKRNLETHVQTKHLKEFSYKCEVCDYKTNCKFSLEAHIKLKHLKEFNYACSFCEHKTHTKYSLEKHIKSKHLKEFRYKCESCTYKTNSNSNLKEHVKTKHLKEFDYKCEMCDYRSNNKVNFKSHTKTRHLKEFDYKCELCKFKTNHKSSFKIHIDTMHFENVLAMIL